MVECALCGLLYDASARTARDISAGRVEARCVLHRKRKPRAATVTATLTRWWLDRYTVTELREIGGALVDFLPPSARQPEMKVLVASAAPRISSNGDVEGEQYGEDVR
jgi:hypothetical protein